MLSMMECHKRSTQTAGLDSLEGEPIQKLQQKKETKKEKGRPWLHRKEEGVWGLAPKGTSSLNLEGCLGSYESSREGRGGQNVKEGRRQWNKKAWADRKKERRTSTKHNRTKRDNDCR